MLIQLIEYSEYQNANSGTINIYKKKGAFYKIVGREECLLRDRGIGPAEGFEM